MNPSNPQRRLADLLAICAAADGEITDDEIEHIRGATNRNGLDFPSETLRRLNEEEFDDIVDKFCARVPASPRVHRALYRIVPSIEKHASSASSTASSTSFAT